MEPEAPSTPQRKAGRDWLKCTYCREGRRKCEPEDYDFSRGEKCLGCIRGKKRCSPRVPHSEQDSVSNSTPESHMTSNSSVRHSTSFTSSSGSSGYRTASIIPPTSGPATISFGSPIPNLSERQRGRIRSSISGNEAKKLLPKEVGPKLIELGYLGDVYHSLRHRLKTIIAESPDVEPIFQKEVTGLISSISDLVLSRCNHLSKDVSDAMPFVVPRAERESACHTFDRKLRHLISLQSSHPSLDQSTGGQRSLGSRLAAPDDFRKLKCFHCKVISLLAILYEEAGDHSQCLRMKEEANALETEYSLTTGFTENPTSEDFDRVSDGMNAAFHNLEIPSRHAQTLPDVNTIFPSAQLAVHRQYPAVAQDIVQAGADLHQCDILKRHFLHIAVETRNQFLVELALRQDDIGQERDIFNQTALCLAAYIGDLDIFLRLLSAGGHNDTSVRNASHRSILTIASGAGSYDIVKYLLENEFCPVNDPLVPQHEGPPSALFAAARGGHADIVDILLGHGASAVLQCKGVLPWEIARHQGHKAIAEQLQKVARDEGERLDALRLTNQHPSFQLPDENADFQLSNDEWQERWIDYNGSQLDSGSGSASLLSNASGTAAISTVLAPPTPIISEPQHPPLGLSRDPSRSGSAVTPSPRPTEPLPPALIDLSRKRSHPSSPHRTPSCPGERSSRQSSGQSKRHQASNC